MGFDVVLWDATTGGVHHPEVELRAGVTLLGGAAEPGDRFNVILWDAFTDGVTQPEYVLHLGVTLLGGAAERGDPCSRINRRTRSCEVRILSTRSFAHAFRYPSP